MIIEGVCLGGGGCGGNRFQGDVGFLRAVRGYVMVDIAWGGAEVGMIWSDFALFLGADLGEWMRGRLNGGWWTIRSIMNMSCFELMVSRLD